MSTFQWRRWLHEAAKHGVPPRDFWRLSVFEFLALIAPRDDAPLSRADLQNLMRLFPDEQ